MIIYACKEDRIMASRIVRIESITIDNFKNVTHGTLDFENKRKDYKASVLGLYGQNGSGKTALIDAIHLLKLALCGKAVPKKYADYINVDTEYATLEYKFVVRYPEIVYNVWYQFSIRKVIDESAAGNAETTNEIATKVEIFDEVFAFSYKSKNDKMRKAPLIDTRTDKLFTPKAKMQELVGNDKEKYMDLLVTKRLTKATSRSFIFSRELINQYRRNCRNELYMKLIESLYMFGHRELFVIDTERIGFISLNTLPLVFKYRNETSEAVGGVLRSLNGPALIPEDTYGIVENVIKNMNIVLEQLVPGLRIGVVDLGSTMTKDEKIEIIKCAVEVTHKNESSTRKIPVIAGTGSNNTKEAIEMSKIAESLGVDGVLVVTPYYNKTTQTGLVAHYSAIAENIDIPIILYNVPSRTGMNIEPETCLELSKIDNIVAIKEASR